MISTRTLPGLAVLAVAGLALTACSGGDPLADTTTPDAGSETIVVGSQDYYSNEIIAEIYAQALEAEGYDVDRQFRIGQREAYLPEIEAGTIDLFPEYTGPVLQYWEPDTDARLADDVYAALQDVLPEGLRTLDQSEATDQDAYTVTRAFADQWDLTTIDDLAEVTVPLTLGGNSEGENRPNGPAGLKNTYGIDVGFTPIEDGGGPLTVKALQDGDVQLAIIYTADPSVVKNNLVTLRTRRACSSPRTSSHWRATRSTTTQRPSSTRSAPRCPPPTSSSSTPAASTSSCPPQRSPPTGSPTTTSAERTEPHHPTKEAAP